MKKKILIVNTAQFGYHLDTYYYCMHLKEEFDITYLCWDYGKEKIPMDGISIIYESRNGGKLQRNLSLFKKASNLSKENFDVLFVVYMPGCSILKLFYLARNKVIMDIRTGSTTSQTVKRFMLNSLVKFESLFFSHVSVISEGLRDMLRISPQKSSILPLGADVISDSQKYHDSLRILYVGNLTAGRRIKDTINGFAAALKTNELASCEYRIIGEGKSDEKDQLRKYANELGIGDKVHFLGFIHHENLKEHFDWANVGVSYVPITPYYNYQPPTKTFEYICSGIPVIATNTSENGKVVNDDNGVLISDNAESFCDGIIAMYEKISKFDFDRIRHNAGRYAWKSIVNNDLRPIFDKIYEC